MSWVDYTAERIMAATIIDEPYPHAVVYKVFPEDYYAELLANRSTQGMEVLNPNRPRLIMWMGKKNVPTFWFNFWYKLRQLKPVLEDKFNLPVAGDYDAQLLHDDPGYSLVPHTDIPSKALTGIFYLPEDDSGAKWGTSVIRSDRRCSGAYDHTWGPEFETVEVVPYARNSALFFPAHDHSWHAVEESPIERWIISLDLLH